jgi:hypothetical protein
MLPEVFKYYLKAHLVLAARKVQALLFQDGMEVYGQQIKMDYPGIISCKAHR